MQSQKEQIIELIKNRKEQVLKANGLTDSGDPQYVWVSGIYDDMVQNLESVNSPAF